MSYLKLAIILSLSIFLFSCNNSTAQKDLNLILDNKQIDSSPFFLYLHAGEDRNAPCKEYTDFIKKNFSYYEMNLIEFDFFNKVLNTSNSLCMIIDRDSVISMFPYNELSKFVRDFKSKSTFSTENISRDCKSFDLKYINVLFRSYCKLKRKDKIFMSDITSITNEKPTFYAKYLLAQLYKQIDVSKTKLLYDTLEENASPFERVKYAKELIEILKDKDKLVKINKDEIVFTYTTYEFGKMNMLEESTCVFYYKNVSNNSFVIHNIATNCGCTVPFWNHQPTPPSCKDSVVVKFVAKNRGFNKKEIIIKGNIEGRIVLKVTATIK